MPIVGERRVAGALTLAGSEITESLRRSVGPVDGFLPGAGGGIGIWEAHSNYALATNFAVGPAPYYASSNATLSQDFQADFPFPNEFVAKVASTGAFGQIFQASGFSPAAASGQSWGVSVWVKGPAGHGFTLALDGVNGAFSVQENTQASGIFTGSWQRIAVQRTLTSATTTNVTWAVFATTGTTDTFWVGSPMLCRSPLAGELMDYPYVYNGGTTLGSSATRPASGVLMPASLLSASQGWVAMLAAPGYGPQGFATNRTLLTAFGALEALDLFINPQPGSAWAYNGIFDGSVWNYRNLNLFSPSTAWTAPWQPLAFVWTWGPASSGIYAGGLSGAGPVARITDTWTLAYLGSYSAAATSFWNGNILDFACGKGTLSDADAADVIARLRTGRLRHLADLPAAA